MRLRACHPDPFRPVASPVAHSIAGFWTFLLLTVRSRMSLVKVCRQYVPQLVLLVLLANLADIDLLFGIGIGASAGALHHGFTHSFAAALCVALGVSCLWRIAGTFWRSAALYFLAYSSHLVIDFFTGTKLGWNSTGSGIPLLWPCEKDFGSPLILIVGVKHKDFPAVFSVENLHSGLYELLIFGVVTAALLLLWIRHQKNHVMSHELETARITTTRTQSNERIP